MDITSAPSSDEISIRQAAFTWSKDSLEDLLSRRKFILRIEEEVVFRRGCVNLIIGQTGTGKTSLLMALLGKFIDFQYTAT